MRRYGGGMLYVALPLHMQRGCFRIRTHDQQVTKALLYRCTRARPLQGCIEMHTTNQQEYNTSHAIQLSCVVDGFTLALVSF